VGVIDACASVCYTEALNGKNSPYYKEIPIEEFIAARKRDGMQLFYKMIRKLKNLSPFIL
jgi:hypothetical protein